MDEILNPAKYGQAIPFETSNKNILAAFFKAQLEFDEPKRNGKADVTGKKAKFSYTWSTYEDVVAAVKGPLHRNGITWTHTSSFSIPPDTKAMVMIVTTTLFHAESGESISSSVPFTTIGNDPQQQGSIFTYGKRYTLSGICGLSHETDMDANKIPSDEPPKTQQGASAAKQGLSQPQPIVDPKNKEHRERVLAMMKAKKVKDAEQQLDRLINAVANRDFSVVDSAIERFYPYVKVFGGK
jgi:hypothetical protein